jgi:hypothetical protein
MTDKKLIDVDFASIEKWMMGEISKAFSITSTVSQKENAITAETLMQQIRELESKFASSRNAYHFGPEKLKLNTTFFGIDLAAPPKDEPKPEPKPEPKSEFKSWPYAID